MVAVKPGKPVAVLPPMPEFIWNGDGKKKRDCGRNADKRRIKRYKERYSALKLAILGDDRYCCRPLRAELPETGMGFLLVCKEESHPWIAGQARYGEGKTQDGKSGSGTGMRIRGADRAG
jgi:hypothetical protein